MALVPAHGASAIPPIGLLHLADESLNGCEAGFHALPEWQDVSLPPDSLLNHRFTVADCNGLRSGWGEGYRWYTATWVNDSPWELRCVLELGTPYIREPASWFRLPAGSKADSPAGGWTAIVPLDYRLPAFEWKMEPGQQVDFLLRLPADGPIRVAAPMLWSRENWLSARRLRLTFLTAFFAVMTTIAVFGLIISLVIRTPFRWPWLAVSVCGTALVAVFTGMVGHLLPVGWSPFVALLPSLLAYATLFAAISLVQNLYQTHTFHPRLHRVLLVLRGTLLGFALLSLFQRSGSATWRVLLYGANEALYLLGAIALGVALWLIWSTRRRGEMLLMFLAVVPLLAGIALHALQNLKLLPGSWVLYPLDWTGIIIVTLLLTLILLRRIRLLMDEGFRVFNQALSQRRQNTYALLQREAEVRSAIGADIDERLGPLIQQVNDRLSAMQPPQTEILEQLRAAEAEIRGICDNRIPSNLTGQGLLNALREISQPLEAAGTRVELRFPRSRRVERLDLLYQMVLFRIAQGLLNNVYKHAAARQVSLQIGLEGGELGLDMRDDGVGFEPDRAGGGGRGLAIIRQRVQSLGGTLRVNSRPGEGSDFFIRIPVRF